MLILGLQGSPRKGGNTDQLLAAFMEKAVQAGAVGKTIQVPRAGIVPCRGCGYCEKRGSCVIADDPMSTRIFGLLRAAEIVVAASPVFFYGITAQLKGLVDRCQTLWSRKYVFKLKDPLAATRRGVLLSVAASHGRQLFDGVHLTAKYFFDAIDAPFDTALTYRGVEAKGAIQEQTGMAADIDAAIAKTVAPLSRRKRVLFVSMDGACRAPMAAALAQQRYGTHLQTEFCALSPTPPAQLSSAMLAVMEEKRVDLGYCGPRKLKDGLLGGTPDLVVRFDGDGGDAPPIPGVKTVFWPQQAESADMARLYSAVARQVDALMEQFD